MGQEGIGWRAQDDLPGAYLEVHPHGLQHALGMVAAGDLAGEGQRPFTGEGGEEQGRLDLGRGDGQGILAALQARAAHGEGA